MARTKKTRRFLKTAPRPLLVLHRDRGLHERVRRGGGRDFHYRWVPEWELLQEELREAPPAALVVVDPYESGQENGAGGEEEPTDRLRELLESFPSATVLAAFEVAPRHAPDVLTLGDWGVTDVISVGEDDTEEAIARRLRAAQGRPLQVLLQRSLPPHVSGHARSILATAAEVVSVGGQGTQLAEALRLSMRTLLRWCERADLPPPRRLLAWMRILLAAELLDDPGRTVLSVAFACGYASDSSLRRALQDFLGTSPTDLRERGAFRIASAGFLEELQLVREGKLVARRQSPARDSGDDEGEEE